MNLDRAIDQPILAMPRLVAVPFLWEDATGEPRGAKTFFLHVIAMSQRAGGPAMFQRTKTPGATHALTSMLRDVTRNVLGDDVEIVVSVRDERRRALPFLTKIRKRNRQPACDLVLVLVEQAGQFPRALDVARQQSSADHEVVIGGAYIRDRLSESSKLPCELQRALDCDVSLFGGDVRRHFERVILDAYSGTLSQVYDFSHGFPSDVSESPVVAMLPAGDRSRVRLASTFRGLLQRCTRRILAPAERHRVVAMSVVDPDGEAGRLGSSDVIVRTRSAA